MNTLNTQLAIQTAIHDVAHRHLSESKANIATALWDKVYLNESLAGLPHYLMDVARLAQIDATTMQRLHMDLYGNIR